MPNEEVPERELLDRLRAGEAQAFETIFRSHYPKMVGLAEAILQARAPAEDAAQDVMLELWRRREGIVLETTLKAYLLRATRNRALNQIRHRRIVERARPVTPAPQAAPSADQDLSEEELRTAVEQAVNDLPERCRDVFELHRVHGLRYAEIAQVLGISIKTVETQMGTALRRLRERLAPWLSEGG